MVLKKALLLLVTGILALSIPGQALAQNASGMRGIVLDKDGAPIPGATVLISNNSLGISQQGTVTDAKGEFRVVPLPPSKGYEVAVSFPGMAKIIVSDLELRAGTITSVPVTLRPDSEMVETLRVTGKTEVVNQATTTTKTNYSEEFIESLPILGRNYQDVLTLAPGVSDVDGDGNPNIHGSRDRDTVTLVDGLSTVDPLTGQRGQELNIDSIQEIEVITSGASAEFSRGQGGFINVITKSGGNDFEGSFSFSWRSNLFDGDGAGLDDPQLHGGLGELGLRDLDFNDYNPSVSVGGPIRRDKAWYFFTAEYRQEEEPVNALTQAFVTGFTQTRAFLKLTWQANQNNKLVFTYTVDPQEFTNLGLNSFTQQEAGFTLDTGGTNISLTSTTIFNPNVFLETKVQHFSTQPQVIPTTDADTNRNGILFNDRNRNGFIEANERDPGEDFDRDGAFDIFEDFNRNGNLDTGEDRDGDGRLTARGACEGSGREDIDCDGRLDFINEDLNGNGQLDPGEDLDGDKRLDLGIEDRNGNQILDDRPFVLADDVFFDENGNLNPVYPYGRLRPQPRDLDYTIDFRTGRVFGPYWQTLDDERGRITLRQDLSVFVPEWHGQHDLKFGGAIERETFERVTVERPQIFDNNSPVAANVILPALSTRLPTQLSVFNEATNLTMGAYVNDTYKPLPNLSIGFGLRFDRETTDSFGYTPFDPLVERRTFDRLWNLGGGERQIQDEAQAGNNDGLRSLGYCSDPIFSSNKEVGGNPCDSYVFMDNDPNRPGVPLVGQGVVNDMNDLRRVASSRLTQHHVSTALAADNLAKLFPEAVDPITGEINRDLLRRQGAATFQERESFRLTNNNLAPRLSISWDPWADGKTKVFANWGRFYDKLFLESVVLEEGPDPIYRYYRKDQDGVEGNGTPNNGVGSVISKAPPFAFQVDRGLETPFSDEFSIGFERELAPEVSLRVTYYDKKGRFGLQDFDINHEIRCCQVNPNTFEEEPLDVLGQLIQGSGSGQGGGQQVRAQDFRPDLYIHNFFFNQVLRLGNFNESRYKSIEMQVVKRLSRKWQMDASYTYSRARGDAEDFNSLLGDDPATRTLEYGYLDFDQRHVVKFNAVTFLPGDWQLGGTLQWSSGLPFSIIDTYQAVDNFDYLSTRVLLGQIAQADKGPIFVPSRRNSERNDEIYTINLRAEKAFVLGRFNSKMFVTVDDLLNTDDLRVFFYNPANTNRSGALQLLSQRQFGRRFQVGFSFDF